MIVSFICLGGERHQHAPAGEEHPHSGGGSDEGEDPSDAPAEDSAGAGPGAVRHPVLHALWCRIRLRPLTGTTGELPPAHHQPDRGEGGSLLPHICTSAGHE